MDVKQSKSKRQKRGSGPRAAAARALGTEASTKPHKRKKVTAQALLLDMLEQLSADGANKKLIYDKLISEAVAGDKDARDWIGKYLLGNGKLSSEDLHRQPIIRPARR